MCLKSSLLHKVLYGEQLRDTWSDFWDWGFVARMLKIVGGFGELHLEDLLGGFRLIFIQIWKLFRA